MCCSSAKWKREVVPDHKFDFIDVDQFHSRSCGSRASFTWLWTTFIISIAVYVADVYTLIALLASNRWAGQILQQASESDGENKRHILLVPFKIGKWIFFACIIVSFLLALWDARKARAIVKSRDISYAFTNVMAHNWYALRSYNHHCFFSQINDSKKRKDSLAFFVFFTFKGWKRLLLADAPRQVINAITLYSFGASQNWTTDLSAYFTGSVLKVTALSTMLFTVIIFAISAVCLLVAAVIYIPLLCTIQGNLKEYCCHKVDKRISELMKRKNRRRLAREADLARREARGDFAHLRDKTGRMVRPPRPQPTLPSVSDDLYLDEGGWDDDADTKHGYPPPSAALARDASYGGVSDSDSITKGGFYLAGPSSVSVTSFDTTAPGSYGADRAPSYRTNPSSRDLVGGDEFYVDPHLAASYPGPLDDSYYAAPPPRHALYQQSRALNQERRHYTASEYDIAAESTSYPSGSYR